MGRNKKHNKKPTTTIGFNPLDSVISPSSFTKEEITEVETPAEAPMRKERVTVHLPVEVIEKLRNAVYWTPHLTMATLTEAAVIQFIEQMETKRGETFPARAGALKVGRPIS